MRPTNWNARPAPPRAVRCGAVRCGAGLGRWCGDGVFDGGDDFFAQRCLLGFEAGDGFAVFTYEEFAEVPFYVAGEEAVLAGEGFVERVLVIAFDVDFFHQRKSHVEFGSAECLDI